MSSAEKSITVSIVKALNWPQGEAHEDLQLSFYSLLSKALILQKNISPAISNRQLIINTSLKITYTSEESQILLKMSRIGEDGKPAFVSEFLIDLDLLQERGVQYLPFEKNDRILEVVSGLQVRDDLKEQKSVFNGNKIDTFIQEKSDFLKNVASNNGAANWTDEKMSSNKNFTQKLYGLLMETRKLRQKIEKQKGKKVDNVGYGSDELNKNSEKLSFNGDELDNERLLVKSSSQNLLTVPVSFTKNGTNNQKVDKASKRWAVAGHYKLDLKNLTILNYNRMAEDTIKQDEDEVLRSKQQGFSSFKGNRHQLSAYLPNINQNS